MDAATILTARGLEKFKLDPYAGIVSLNTNGDKGMERFHGTKVRAWSAFIEK